MEKRPGILGVLPQGMHEGIPTIEVAHKSHPVSGIAPIEKGDPSILPRHRTVYQLGTVQGKAVHRYLVPEIIPLLSHRHWIALPEPVDDETVSEGFLVTGIVEEDKNRFPFCSCGGAVPDLLKENVLTAVILMLKDRRHVPYSLIAVGVGKDDSVVPVLRGFGSFVAEDF
jgi:hypothetical protein